MSDDSARMDLGSVDRESFLGDSPKVRDDDIRVSLEIGPGTLLSGGDSSVDGDSVDGKAGPKLTTTGEELEVIGIGRFQKYIALAICGTANAADAVELLAISFILPELGTVSDSAKSALSASVFLGMLIGGMFAGTMGDKLGRKPLLLASLGVNALFGAISAGSPNWETLAALRIVSGIGVGGSIPTVFTLYVEYLPMGDRGFWISLIAWFWMVGTIFAAGLAWVTIGVIGASWRYFALFCAVPAACAFFGALFLLPESPRFYELKGRLEECEASLKRISSYNNKSCRLDIGYKLTAPKNSEPERTSWQVIKLMFTNRSIKRVSYLLCFEWFFISFGWYGLIIWIPQLFKDANFELDVYQDAFLVSAANLPGNILAAALIDRIGRRYLLCSSMLVSAAFALVFAFAEAPWLVVLAACCFNCFSNGGWNALDCLSTESFPTYLRTTAMGVLAGAGRLGSLSGQFAFGYLIDHSKVGLLILASCTLVAGAFTALLLKRDTMGAQLADNLEGDEDDEEKILTRK